MSRQEVLAKPDGHDYWQDTVTRPQWSRCPEGSFDVVVIGGGLTGLSAALHLVEAQPSLSVAVLEANRIAAGASGINTGIVGPGVGGPISVIRKKFGDERAAAMFQYSQSGVRRLRTLVATHGISCDLTDSRHLLAAGTARQARRLERDAQDAQALGLDIPLLSGDEVAATLGHRHYAAALAYQPVSTVNPLALTLGLAQAAQRCGVSVFEDSPVLELHQDAGRGSVLTLPHTTVRAARVVLAVDGYSSGTLPLRRRVVRLRTHVLATRVLTAQERAAIGWGGREGVIDQRTFFAYYRMSPDGRLILGGGPVTQPDAGARASQQVWQRLETELQQLFPALRQVPVEYRWSGLTGVTIDMLPVVGPVPRRPGVLYAGAWAGHGLSLAVQNGATLAAASTDTGWSGPVGPLPWHRSHTRTPYLGPLQPAFVRSYVATLDLVDRREARADARRRGDRTPAASTAASSDLDSAASTHP